MPRPARPWFRESRAGWYVTFQGKQTPLGVADPTDREAAEAAFRKLIEDAARAAAAEAVRQAIPPRPPDPTPANVPRHDTRTVADLVAGYLSHCDRRAAAGKIDKRSVRNYRLHLDPLTADLGGRVAAGLSPAEVEAWADRDGWSPSYRHGALGTVCQVLKWAGVVLIDPETGRAGKVQRPAKESRGAESVLDDDQFAKVLAAAVKYKGAAGDFVPLLKALRETGARPQEVAKLAAEGVDWQNACTRLREHKTRKKTGKDRVIHFGPGAMAVLESQRAKYPDGGLLFRTRAGKAFGCNVIVKRLITASERAGVKAIAYGLGRHSFATTALGKGVPNAVVAELLGHKGTQMLEHHYSHLGDQARVLKEALVKIGKAG